MVYISMQFGSKRFEKGTHIRADVKKEDTHLQSTSIQELRWRINSWYSYRNHILQEKLRCYKNLIWTYQTTDIMLHIQSHKNPFTTVSKSRFIKKSLILRYLHAFTINFKGK